MSTGEMYAALSLPPGVAPTLLALRADMIVAPREAEPAAPSLAEAAASAWLESPGPDRIIDEDDEPIPSTPEPLWSSPAGLGAAVFTFVLLLAGLLALAPGPVQVARSVQAPVVRQPIQPLAPVVARPAAPVTTSAAPIARSAAPVAASAASVVRPAPVKVAVVKPPAKKKLRR